MRAIIDKYAALPFQYGLDCCQFAGECAEAVSGKNPMDGIEYADKAEAYAIIARFGNLERAMLHYLGDPYDGHKDGDVVLVECDNGLQLAGTVYRGRVVVRTQDSLADWPMSRAKLIWCS